MSFCLTYGDRKFKSENEFKAYVEANPEEFNRYLKPLPGEVNGQAINYSLEALPQSYDSSLGEVDYEFKAAKSIMANMDKIKRWEKEVVNPPVLWEKIQRDLGVSRAQVDLIKNSEGNSVEEKLANFLANYSYTVEINTATTKEAYNIGSSRDFYVGGNEYHSDTTEYLNTEGDPEQKDVFSIHYPDGSAKEITEEEFHAAKKNAKTVNSSYYANVTVPGGTNYTENEIRTPDITPFIKGHAEFSTNEGIGWTRTDERLHDFEKMLSSGIIEKIC